MIYSVKCFAKIKEYSTGEHSLFNPFMYFFTSVEGTATPASDFSATPDAAQE